MNSSSSKRRSWLIPALVAFFAFIGGLASNLLATDLQEVVQPYRPWIWSLAFISLLVAIGAAIWDSRREVAEKVDIRHAADVYDKARRRYLTRIVDRFQYLPLRPIDPKSASADTMEQDRLRMSDVYIALDTTARITEQEAKSEEVRLREDRSLSVLEAVIDKPRLVLTGDPGGGKSTFVNHLAFCLASDGLDARQNWIGQLEDWPEDWARLLPVPIALREVAAWFQVTQPYQRKAGMFHAYLDYWLGEMGLDDFFHLLCEHLADGTTLLLLDGLDEVPLQDDVLERVKEMITDLPNAYPNTRIVVTCRVLSYQDKRWRLDDHRWSDVELAKLNEQQIDHFIHAWYQQLAAMQVVTHASALSAKLSQAVRRPDLWRLATNPLLLTVMALVHTNKGELPDARVLLYEDVVELLLWRWEAIKLDNSDGSETTWRQLLREADLSDIDLKQALWAVAFQVHAEAGAEDGEATADIPESLLLEALRELHPDRSLDWADRLLQIMKLRAGLLVESMPKVYSFPHRTFQEYLAARELSVQPNFTDQVLQLAEQGSYWREVILLAVGWLVHSGNVDQPLVLLDELCPQDMVDSDMGWRNVWLAGQCLLEIGPARARRRSLGRKTARRVQDRLTHLITHDRLTPRERAEAGSVLSALGDPRGLDEMVPIFGGEFTMGSSDVDKDARDSEKPQHTLFVADFRIAKYPVTNGQYARFVAATGHKAPDHWRGDTPPPELRNHPVVRVSWHDARAYCAWLSKERGEEVRLPSEAEWEKAARGMDGRIYPWGDEFDPERCNMDETGIGGTSPVGVFASGTSPYGVLDMSGNMWEWTSSLFEAYPYDADDGREDPGADALRVLRGGAFGSSRRWVRCACRNLDVVPYGRLNLIGFRVVSPGLEPLDSGISGL